MVKNEKSEKKGMSDELPIPEGVNVTVAGNSVTMKGPKGEASTIISEPSISVKMDGQKAIISSLKSAKKDKTRIGSYRAHLANIIKGVTEGHVYKLKICYTHFPINVSVSGKKITIKNLLGEKTPKEIIMPDNVKAKVEGADVTIESPDKENASQTAALIEQSTKRSGFDIRVFVDGIYITMKDGKDIK
jgi:large subunit ribosomal protein L6